MQRQVDGAALLLAVAIAAAALWTWRDYTGPGPLATSKVVVIAHGAHLRDIADALAEAGVVRHAQSFMLGVLAERQINMTKLESRPSRDRPWEYIFYVDVDGDVALPALAAALEDLRALTRRLLVLGSYPIIGERAG